MRMTLMITGPHLKHKVITEPHHLIELTPTVFDLIGYNKEVDFDASPIQDIYEDSNL